MPIRTPTLRTVVALITLAGLTWLTPAPPTAAWAPTPTSSAAADLLAGSSGQPGDPDAG